MMINFGTQLIYQKLGEMETIQDVKMNVYKFGNKTADGNTSMKNLLGW